MRVLVIISVALENIVERESVLSPISFTKNFSLRIRSKYSSL